MDDKFIKITERPSCDSSLSGYSMLTHNLNDFEIIGLLRFFEKQIHDKFKHKIIYTKKEIK